VKKLLSPEAAQAWLRRRFDNQHRGWLEGAGGWPLVVLLGEPTEKDASEDPGFVRGWVDAWRGFRGPGKIDWEERRWPRLGAQQLPVRLKVESPRQVAVLIGQEARWQRASERYDALVSAWPKLRGAGVLTRLFDVLADYAALDFARLVALVAWLEQNPRSGCYPRQLPILGMDTKWLDAKRRALVVDLLQNIRGDSEERDFHVACGLRRPAPRIRVRVLCPQLRQSVGGLTDVEAPLEELTALVLRPQCALIVENLETGIALPELPGVVALMKLGSSVSVLGGLSWLREVPVLYWGDLDTHGFAILDQARRVLPQLRSLLMDEPTLLSHRALWVEESSPHSALELSHLTREEHAIFDSLRAGTWGRGVRLEQERICWPLALDAVRRAVAQTASAATAES
jgi:hypothetical protein